MPGPVSDSFDPEFGTGGNAADVAAAMREVVEKITSHLGPGRKYIVDVAREASGETFWPRWSERELRIIRFGLERALETI